MKNEALLPVEFIGLVGKVNYVQKARSDEYSSSCPQCGGTPHKGGELPDRFRMFLNAHGKNKVMGWCRRCNYVWFPDNKSPYDPQEFEKWRKEQIEREEERKRSAEKALNLLRSEQIWDKYHLALNDYAKEIIKGWGIRQDWADYWKLGLVTDYLVNGVYHSPAISIPVWQLSEKVPANIKLRILNPKDTGDRYRAVYKMGRDFLFAAFPGLKADTCLLVEGEKKAMVCAQWSEQKFQVVGTPSKTPSPESLTELDKFGKIIIVLDPDAYEVQSNGVSPVRRLADLLGRDKVSQVQLFGKVDDMILNGLKIQDAIRYDTEVK